MSIDSKYGCPRCDPNSIMDGYPVIIFQILYNSTYIKGSTLYASAVRFRFKLRPNAVSLEELKMFSLWMATS